MSDAAAPSLAASTNPDPSSFYTEFYYAHDCGIPYERNEHWLNFFGAIANNIARKLQPRTMLDAGCAKGFLVEQLVAAGIDAHGVDVSEYAISQVHESVKARCRVASLAEPIGGRYDLVVTVEVIEHIPAELAERALDNICAVTDAVLFSSSPHDYAEATHINVKSPEQWAALFAERGFVRDVDHDASYLTAWAVLYRRSAAPLADVVRDYERLLWTTRTENQQLRSSVLDFQARLDDAARDEPQRSAVDEELHATRNALLVARDSIASLEARVGEASGERDRLASLAASREAAVRELELMRNSRMWKLVSALAAPVRRRRA